MLVNLTHAEDIVQLTSWNHHGAGRWCRTRPRLGKRRRDLKTGQIVVRGPGGGGCDCDEDYNHARWFAPDSFEIAVAHSNSGGGWQRLSGVASARRIHVDTLSDEPDWH